MAMKIYNCRFAPTTNGSIHLGHVFTALVNEFEAHKSGGKFTVRFDDAQEWRTFRQSRNEINRMKQIIIDDFEWLGVKVDDYMSDSEIEMDVKAYLLLLNKGELAITKMVVTNNSPESISNNILYYPYHPWLTAQKVIADWMIDINYLIRGEDLITESSLYAYFCEIWRIPQPRQVYIPRLNSFDGSEVSKTVGSTTINQMREAGYKSEDIYSILINACLKNKDAFWTVDNIKSQPILDQAWSKKS